jgi:hypothetical protein
MQHFPIRKHSFADRDMCTARTATGLFRITVMPTFSAVSFPLHFAA